MTTKGFIENGFIINLGNAKDAAEIIYELSNILEFSDAQNKNICLKLGAIDLRQSQLLSIKALIESMDSKLEFIDTDSEQTESSATNLGIEISKLSNEIAIEEETEVEEEETDEVVPETEIEIEDIDDTYKELKQPEAETTEETEEEDASEEENREMELEISKLPTLYLQQTLRSGQTMSYDGNIVIIGDVHPGSEIIAKGDITIWGILGGIAHAGARGNNFAKIRALKINAIQLRISGYYARRPDTLNIPFIQKTNDFTPETAVVKNKKIAIYKVNE